MQHIWWQSLIAFRSSFAVALMNTSPEEQVADVLFEDVFRDLVWATLFPNSFDFALIYLFKTKEWRDTTYTVYDLWEKDEKGEWGQNLGTMSGSIQGVAVASHLTKVWKLVPSSQQLRKRGRHAHPRRV